MPITMTPLPVLGTPITGPSQPVGPGLGIELNSSFIGPMPTGSYWRLQAASDDGLSNLVIDEVHPYQAKDQVLIMGKYPSTDPWSYTINPQYNQPVYVGSSLHSPTAQVDTGAAVPFTWDPVSGVPFLIQWFSQQPAPSDPLIPTINTNVNTILGNWDTYTGVTLPSLQDVLNGITSGITATITGVGGAVTQTLGQIFTGTTFDKLEFVSLGTACSPSDVYANLGTDTFYGFKIDVTSWPDWIAFTGPASDYAQQSLATVVLQRGGDTIYWHGMHTLSHVVYPLPGISFWEWKLSMPSGAGDYTLTVTPNTGVCVSVTGISFP